MGFRPTNPKTANIYLDSCAFDPKYSPEDQASLRLFELKEKGELILHIAHSTQKEVEHPNTPSWVKREANKLSYTKQTSLTESERVCKSRILSILAGKGKPEKMKEDARHVFESDKYGDYFITTDERILKKKAELRQVVSVTILRPSEFLDIIASYENIKAAPGD